MTSFSLENACYIRIMLTIKCLIPNISHVLLYFSLKCFLVYCMSMYVNISAVPPKARTENQISTKDTKNSELPNVAAVSPTQVLKNTKPWEIPNHLPNPLMHSLQNIYFLV